MIPFAHHTAEISASELPADQAKEMMRRIARPFSTRAERRFELLMTFVPHVGAQIRTQRPRAAADM